MEKWKEALEYYSMTLEEAKETFGFFLDADIKRFIVELYEDDTAPERS